MMQESLQERSHKIKTTSPIPMADDKNAPGYRFQV